MHDDRFDVYFLQQNMKLFSMKSLSFVPNYRSLVNRLDGNPFAMSLTNMQ